ncbi:MAG: CooT family nickel-binding protein [Actinobacteria bacterium]|nr:CooT family nickel-binding protein [Actinomycetota bacterium]
MCESNVYVCDDEGDRLVMEDAVLLEEEDGKIKITDILGEVKELEGDVEEITFLEHKIVIRER